jgi:hypothetical protein
MNIIGNLAAALFVITGVLMLAPLFLFSAIKESYKNCNFWEFVTDIPVWIHYLAIGWLSILFWVAIGYLLS